ncbi:O-methyltransferase [Selenomonas ruminantium]|uniref:Predicted O-methyltransferase YrrM n=1 Tax=Selenomonas ruminantium TaxID=971 RepID=A0A1I0VCM8_SELRU|nr:O-methyltransferase [Selenomonas ruminantium]SFA73346.1 Predicted O-methyltransferase YrrM [Selenomonas ruminantium]
MDELLREMEGYAALHHVPIINERGRQAFLRVVQEAKPHRVLEIGTAIGYSSLLMAQNGAADIEITTLELSDERIKVAQGYIDRSAYADRIHIMGGDAAENLLKLQMTGQKFDFVFIDAAKGQYVDYFHKIQSMLAAKAVILADNVLFRGYVKGDVPTPRRFKTIVKRLREYIELVSQPPYVTEILENGDGLAVTRRLDT